MGKNHYTNKTAAKVTANQQMPNVAGVNPNQPNPLVANPQQLQFLLQQQIASGPLPVSKEFEGYEKVLPGSAERILIMAENEQKSRMDIAKSAIELQNKQLDNVKSIETTKAWGGLIHKSASAIAILGIVLIAIFREKQDLMPYLMLLTVIAAPEAKPYIEKYFTKK